MSMNGRNPYDQHDPYDSRDGYIREYKARLQQNHFEMQLEQAARRDRQPSPPEPDKRLLLLEDV